MPKPAYKVKIGQESFDSSTGGDIVSVYLDLGMEVPLDAVKVSLKQNGKQVKRGDSIEVQLGYEGNVKKVFTGSVDKVEPRVSDVLITGYSLFSLLTSTKTSQVYENQSASDIVKDLADKCGMSAKEPSDGLSFPSYVVTNAQSIYAYMRELADKCGFRMYSSADGHIIFKEYERDKPKPLKYGRDILESEVNELTPSASCVKVYGESPSSFKGADTAHVISKEVVEGVAGSGEPVITFQDPMVKDKETADRVALAKLEAIRSSLKGIIKTPGNPGVYTGDTIEIKEAPDARMNGEFEVTGVNHVFSSSEGYMTTISWRKRASISQTEPPLVERPSAPPAPKKPGMLEQMKQDAEKALADSKQALIDAVEAAEEALDGMVVEVNNAVTEMNKKADEMLAEADKLKNEAEKAAQQLLAKADELKKELEAQKKKMQDAIDEQVKKYDDLKKDAMEQVDKYANEILKYKKEAQKYVDEGKKKLDDVKKIADDKRKELEEPVNKAKKKVQGVLDDIDKKKKELEKKKQELLDKIPKASLSTGESSKDFDSGVGEKIDAQVKKLENEIDSLSRKADELKKEVEEKQKLADDAMAEVKGKQEEIEKEVDEKVKAVEDKIKEVEDKVNQAKKSVEDLDKEMKEAVGDLKKQMDEAVKAVEAQIDEIKGEAEKMLKEADEKYKEAVRSVNAARKETAAAVESMNKSYDAAKDKVKDTKKSLGLSG